MVSCSQHAAGCATDACHSPVAACFIAGPELRRWPRRRADRRLAAPQTPPWSRGPGRVEHEKNSIFLIIGKQPQRGRRSGARALCAFIEAKRRPLTAAAAQATRVSASPMPIPAPILSFHHVYAAATLVTPAATAHRPFLS